MKQPDLFERLEGADPYVAAGPAVPPAENARGQASSSSTVINAREAFRATGAATRPVRAVAAVQPSDERDGSPKTLEEVRRELRARGGGSRRTGELCSALNTVAKVVGRPLAAISTDPRKLVALLRRAKPAGALVAKTHWGATCSRLRAALKECGVGVMPGRETEGLSERWRELGEHLPSPGARIGLSRLLSYLSRQGVDPRLMRADHLEGFRTALAEGSLHKEPRQAFVMAARWWNEARASVEGWPQIEAVTPADPRRYSLAWNRFPRSFTEDVEAFLAHSGNPDVLSDDYHPKVSPGTVALRRRQLAQLASGLVYSGFDVRALTSLKVLVAPDNAKAALRFLLDRQGGEKSTSLTERATLLVTIARYHVKSLKDAEKIRGFTKGLAVRRQGMTEKNRLRLDQLDLKANRDALLLLPRRIAANLAAVEQPTVRDAQRYMLALAVELLTRTAMRMDNLAGLQPDRNLLRVRRGRSRIWRIVIPKEEVKNRQPFDVPLGDDAAQMLEAWLDRYRPLLWAEAGPYLFPGRTGGRRDTTAFSQAISKFIHRETGIEMNPHLFRHWCVKLHLEANPNDIETARQLLGHTSSRTTQRSYADLKTDRAFKTYDATLERHRAAAEAITPLKDRPGSRKP
jgi:integrase